ncbi:MAG: phytanoyl-CoA dioxygenase family protein [Pseudomonadota bacterium]
MAPLDLAFRPVRNTAPRRLTPDQIAHYNRLGYAMPFDVFSTEEAAQNRAYFDGLLAQVADRGGYAINCYQARCAGIWDLCTEDRILDLVQDIIGPDIVCWASHFFCKMPGDPKPVPWHQDASYWKLSPARTVTVWLAIDDADPENAAMQFLPGTHDKGHLEFRKVEGSVLSYETVGVEDMGAPVSDTLRAGQVSLHADMLVHGSAPNTSNRRRCGLTLRYCPPDVRMTDDGWAEGVEAIICRGSDRAGYWTHHPRPLGDDVRAKDGPRNVGGN